MGIQQKSQRDKTMPLQLKEIEVIETWIKWSKGERAKERDWRPLSWVIKLVCNHKEKSIYALTMLHSKYLQEFLDSRVIFYTLRAFFLLRKWDTGTAPVLWDTISSCHGENRCSWLLILLKEHFCAFAMCRAFNNSNISIHGPLQK